MDTSISLPENSRWLERKASFAGGLGLVEEKALLAIRVVGRGKNLARM